MAARKNHNSKSLILRQNLDSPKKTLMKNFSEELYLHLNCDSDDKYFVGSVDFDHSKMLSHDY